MKLSPKMTVTMTIITKADRHQAAMPTVRLTGHDADPDVRATVDRLNLVDDVADTVGASVTDADLVILCVPVGAMAITSRPSIIRGRVLACTGVIS